MKTRLFSTFLALAMCLTLLPVAALAEEQELQTLINEATEGGTVTLAKDYTVADTSVTVNKNLTIDFSTFKVTGSLFNKGDGTENDNRYLIRIAEGKTVTFTNAKLDNNSGRAIEVGPGATLTLNGSNTDIKGADNTIVCVGTLEANGGQISCSSTSKSSSAILVGSTAYTSDNAKATIKNTTITNTTGGGVAAVKNSNVIIDAGTEITTGDHALNGNNLAPTQNITVKAGAVIKSNNEAAVYKAATGTLIIEGGTITGKGGIVCRAGTTTITGGTITAESTSNIPAGERHGRLLPALWYWIPV